MISIPRPHIGFSPAWVAKNHSGRLRLFSCPTGENMVGTMLLGSLEAVIEDRTGSRVGVLLNVKAIDLICVHRWANGKDRILSVLTRENSNSGFLPVAIGI